MISVENLEYNTQRTQLMIPEYGRHIQKMIHQVINIQDQKKRNQMAHAIIGVMGNLNPHLRDVPDFQHKLWDQLFIISDFQLDVESPYPKISKEMLRERPQKLKYPETNHKYRFYGNNLKKMIDVAAEWKDKDTLPRLHNCIANHMKKSYLNYNKDTVEDTVIFEHLRELSSGQIDLASKEINLADADKLLRLSAPKSYQNQKNKNRNQNQKKRKRNG